MSARVCDELIRVENALENAVAYLATAGDVARRVDAMELVYGKGSMADVEGDLMTAQDKLRKLSDRALASKKAWDGAS